jgi:hypothetical protein
MFHLGTAIDRQQVLTSALNAIEGPPKTTHSKSADRLEGFSHEQHSQALDLAFRPPYGVFRRIVAGWT